MILSKIPKWILTGAGILAFVSGLVNVVAILAFTHHAATHMTGIFSLFSIALFEVNRISLLELAAIIFCFFAGAVITGLILHDAHLKMGPHYELVMILEGALLFASAWLFYKGLMWGEYAAAMAAGLQNAMASTYSGAIIRTTHLTGILTDFGVLIGHRLKGVPADGLKMKLFATLILAFVAGGFIGAWAYQGAGAMAMTIPAFLICFCGVSYRLLRKKSP
ncbi:MAG TPA: YoaK family protein [Candidatus Omnitrophota bacterium]|nr:YoaK family protein [Candidatus Omnitrophota bacterium]